ncbi:hypothetical protein F0562_006407 [Nyssa sinensis]|uniref:Uncharacterized protein n=1 Tax=Nyssa sinensis TaxID=561372 RepID=A0A5J5AQ13_9ASTE|nr:hypothetical protein F0562_006407 [Nyssa sinensis]
MSIERLCAILASSIVDRSTIYALKVLNCWPFFELGVWSVCEIYNLRGGRGSWISCTSADRSGSSAIIYRCGASGS